MGMYFYVVHGLMIPAWPAGRLVWRFKMPMLLPSQYWHVNDYNHLLYHVQVTEWPDRPRARGNPLGRSLLGPDWPRQFPHVTPATSNNPRPALEYW